MIAIFMLLLILLSKKNNSAALETTLHAENNKQICFSNLQVLFYVQK